MIYLLWTTLANWKRMAVAHHLEAIAGRRLVRASADERVAFHGF